MAFKPVTAGRDSLGEFAPEFAAFNDDILFGQVWSREQQLSPRDRSLITVTALMTGGIFDSSLEHHLNKAKENGVTRTEIVEAITQLAFYSGWPKAWAVFRLAKDIWGDQGQDDGVPAGKLFPIGQPNDAYADYFIGQSYLCPLCTEGVPVSNVTFEPGCRNNWHIHHKGGQILLVTGGCGWYQEAGKPAQALRAGDVIYIAPEVKHWHGAARDCWFQHLAVEIPAEGASNEWLEPVSAEIYDALQ